MGYIVAIHVHKAICFGNYSTREEKESMMKAFEAVRTNGGAVVSEPYPGDGFHMVFIPPYAYKEVIGEEDPNIKTGGWGVPAVERSIVLNNGETVIHYSHKCDKWLQVLKK